MRTPSEADPDLATVVAAQRGDRSALNALAAAYLPLVYNIVGRAMNGHPDVDDVVQETMLRAISGIGELRDPGAFRSWLVAIAIRQVRDSYRDRLAQPPAVESEVPSPDFADQTITRLGLTGQRLETAAATRWLDDEDRPVLALWWQEAAGELSRAELAGALGISPAHAAVRVARMKERLDTSRTVVRALHRSPQCPGLAAITSRMGRRAEPAVAQAPGPACPVLPVVPGRQAELVPAERLLGELSLIAVPAGLCRPDAQPAWRPAAQAAEAVRQRPGAPGMRGMRGAAAEGRRPGPRPTSSVPSLVAVSLAVVTCAAGGTLRDRPRAPGGAPAASGASRRPRRPARAAGGQAERLGQPATAGEEARRRPRRRPR